MASASDSTRRRDASNMTQMTRKHPHSPSGIPSRGEAADQADARIEECRHCGARIAYRRDRAEPRYFNEVAPHHRCLGRDKEDRERLQQRQSEAAIDTLVEPIIAARVGVFLPRALAAVQGEPFPVYSDSVSVSAAEQDRRDREAERVGRPFLIRQLLQRTLARIMELVPSVSREEILAYVEEALPTAGRGRPPAPFDPELVEQAYREIRRAFPAMKSRKACQEIARRLSVSRKTIENLRSRKK
jgi:hypothetical protein